MPDDRAEVSTIHTKENYGVRDCSPEAQREGPQGLFVVIVVASSSVSPSVRAVLADVFLADRAAEPLHHATDEGEHLLARARKETDRVFQPGVVPVLVEQN